MKKFIVKLSILALPVLVLLVGVNYFGDAANLFSYHYEKAMVEIVNNGKSVTNISNFDERTFQKELILSEKIIPDVVVIGSSKTLLIDKSFFYGLNFKNNSIAGANFNDIIAVYQWRNKLHKLPKTIILGLDPWMLNEDIEGYDLDTKEVKRHQANNDRTAVSRFVSLFSLSYFQRSVRLIPSKIVVHYRPVATEDTVNNNSNVRNPDGSLTYAKSYRQSTSTEVKQRLDVYLKRGDATKATVLQSVSKEKLKKLHTLIEEMRERHVKLVFLLTPYHPSIYKKITNKSTFFYPEVVLRKVAKSNKIKCIGSFNPETCGLNEAYFYDAIHCTEMGIRRIWNNEQP